MKKAIHFIKKYIYKSNEDYVTIHAAYTTLFLFMSLFPMIMFILNLLSLIDISDEYLIAQVDYFVPLVFHDFAVGIIMTVKAQSSGFFLSISVLLSLWAASSGIYGLLLGLNDCYRTYDTRSYFVQRSLSIIYTLVFVVMVVLSLVLLVFGNMISDALVNRFPDLELFLIYLKRLKYPVLFVVFVLFFDLIFYALPNMRTTFFFHTPGSCFATAGWLLLSYFYSIYVNKLTDLSLYGSLAIVVLFLLWLWIATIIVFLGAELNAMIYDRKYGTENYADVRFRYEEKIRNYRENAKSLTSADIYNMQKSTTRQMETTRILNDMKKELEEADEERREKEKKEKHSNYSNE